MVEKETELREQDKWLPIANVYRIMKKSLPKNAKVSKEAKECVQECVSEFVSFITSEASEKCSAEKRKTVNGEDILFAMTSLGFENYAEVLKIYLTKYREYLATKDKTKRTQAFVDDQEPMEPMGDHEPIREPMEERFAYNSYEESMGEPLGEHPREDYDYAGQFTNVDMANFDNN